jgi:branched-chain amino acid transport system permease protein
MKLNAGKIKAEREGNPSVERLAMGLFISCLAGSFVLPGFLSTFFVRTLAEFYFFMIMTNCFNILGGRTGYLNLGQGVFIGIGAYGMGVCVQAGIPYGASVLVVASIGISWGAMISPLLFRLKGAAFALVNLALLFIFMAASMRFRVLTGGTDGLFLGSSADLSLAFYGQGLLLLLVTIVSIFIPRNRMGYQTSVMGQDSFLAESIGIPTLWIKVKLYTLCSAILTLSGSFLMIGEGYIIPSTVFGLQISLLPVAMAMVGGLGNTLGPLWGTLLVFGIREWLWVYVGSMEQTLLGLMLILAGKRKALFQRTMKLFQ